MCVSLKKPMRITKLGLSAPTAIPVDSITDDTDKDKLNTAYHEFCKCIP